MIAKRLYYFGFIISEILRDHKVKIVRGCCILNVECRKTTLSNILSSIHFNSFSLIAHSEILSPLIPVNTTFNWR